MKALSYVLFKITEGKEIHGTVKTVPRISSCQFTFAQILNLSIFTKRYQPCGILPR